MFSEILSYRQKILTTLYNRVLKVFFICLNTSTFFLFQPSPDSVTELRVPTIIFPPEEDPHIHEDNTNINQSENSWQPLQANSDSLNPSNQSTENSNSTKQLITSGLTNENTDFSNNGGGEFKENRNLLYVRTSNQNPNFLPVDNHLTDLR